MTLQRPAVDALGFTVREMLELAKAARAPVANGTPTGRSQIGNLASKAAYAPPACSQRPIEREHGHSPTSGLARLSKLATRVAAQSRSDTIKAPLSCHSEGCVSSHEQNYLIFLNGCAGKATLAKRTSKRLRRLAKRALFRGDELSRFCAAFFQ